MDITVTRLGYNQSSSAFLSSGSSDFLNITLFVTASPCAAQVDPNISILCVRVLGPQTFATKTCTGFWNTCVHVGVGLHWGGGGGHLCKIRGQGEKRRKIQLGSLSTRCLSFHLCWLETKKAPVPDLCMGPEYTCPGTPSVWKEEAGSGLFSTFLPCSVLSACTQANLLETP